MCSALVVQMCFGVVVEMRSGVVGQMSQPRRCSGTVVEMLSRWVRKVDARLHGKGNSNTHGARPVNLIIKIIKWIRTSRLSTKNSLSLEMDEHYRCCPRGYH